MQVIEARHDAATAPFDHTVAGAADRKRSVLRVAALALALAVLAPCPDSVREIPMLALGLGLPSFLWGRYLYERLTSSAATAGALGTLVTLAGWSLLEFGFLVARVPVSSASASVLLLLLCLIPLLGNRPLPRAPISADAITLRQAGTAAALLAAGAALLVGAMATADRHSDSPAAFAIFWAAMLVMYVPLFVLLVQHPGWHTGILISALATGTYLPTLVRSPRSPYLNDEIAHWGETVRMLTTGSLFQPDAVLTIGPKYPGLETMAAGLVQLTGLPVIDVGRTLILLCHVAAAFGIAALARCVGASSRGAALAAALYAISPSLVQIDNMFSYESFAVPLAIWIVVGTFEAMTADASARRRWLTVTAVLAVDLVITHHLTTLAFALALLLIALGCKVRPVQGAGWRTPASVGSALLVSALLWAFATRAPLPTYLGNFLRFAGDGLRSRLGIGQSAQATSSIGDANGASRDLFGGSLLPSYERVMSIGAQPLLFLAFCYALWLLRRQLRGPLLGLAVLASAYFLSLPFTLIGGASAGAHRSWAVSFVGLAVVIGVTFDAQFATARLTSRSTRSGISAVQIIALGVILMGSFAAADNAYTRLPGPYQLGSDGRTISADTIRSAEWFQRTQGAERTIATNTRTLMIFGSYGHALQNGFPKWTIFFPTRFDPAAVRQFLASGTDYIVVDSRLATDYPTESYFASFEPDPPSIPLPKASLTKFANAPWLRLIHVDGHVSIYRVVRT